MSASDPAAPGILRLVITLRAKKTQKFIFRLALRPNQISFSHSLDPSPDGGFSGSDHPLRWPIGDSRSGSSDANKLREILAASNESAHPLRAGAPVPLGAKLGAPLTKADRSSCRSAAISSAGDHAATTKGYDHAQTQRIAIGREAYAVSL